MLSMAQVIAFRPWMYDTAVAGPLDALIAPPYDVITPDQQAELCRRSPYNVVRLDLNPSQGANRYEEAARLWNEWRASGVFRRAPQPQVTIVEETFVGPDGISRVRKGVLALVRLTSFEEGVVLPHEETLSAPKEDRLLLMRATRASFSPVFLLYHRPDDAIMAAWARLVDRPPDASVRFSISADTGDGPLMIRLWHATQPSLLETVSSALSEQTLIIADGHHRYETALIFRDECRTAAKGGSNSVDRVSVAAAPPFEFVFAYLVNMADPGLAVFATHRLVRGLSQERLARLVHDLTSHFIVEHLADGLEEGREAVQVFLENHRQRSTAFGMVIGPTRSVYGLILRPEFRGQSFSVSAQRRSDAYRMLDVTVLRDLVLESHLGISCDMASQGGDVAFVKDFGRAFRLLGDETYQVGFFLNPTPLDQVRAVALAGDRMPQKSTYFYPKLPTGLLFYDLGNGR